MGGGPDSAPPLSTWTHSEDRPGTGARSEPPGAGPLEPGPLVTDSTELAWSCPVLLIRGAWVSLSLGEWESNTARFERPPWVHTSGQGRGGPPLPPALPPSLFPIAFPEPPLGSWGGPGQLEEGLRESQPQRRSLFLAPKALGQDPASLGRAELRQLRATGATSQEPLDSGGTPHGTHSPCACTLPPSLQPLASVPECPHPRPALGPRQAAPRFLPGAVGAGGSDARAGGRWPRSGCRASAGCPGGLNGRGEGRRRGQGRPRALAPGAARRAGRQRGPLSAAGGARAAGPGRGRGGRRRPAPPAGRARVRVSGALCPASFPPPFGARGPRAACWAAYPGLDAGRRGASPADERGPRPSAGLGRGQGRARARAERSRLGVLKPCFGPDATFSRHPGLSSRPPPALGPSVRPRRSDSKEQKGLPGPRRVRPSCGEQG